MASSFAKMLLIGFFCILIPANLLLAATITVNDAEDANGTVPTGRCTLREAIIAANTDKPVDGCVSGDGDDTILVPAGMYTLAIAGTDEDGGMTGDLDITGNLILTGEGAGKTIIDGGGIDRVLHIDPACTGINASISALTIRNGQAPDSTNAAGGGGLYNCGNLTLSDVEVSANSAVYFGKGGGIFNQGVLNGRNLIVRNNTAFWGGGIGNSGTLLLSGARLDGNVSSGSVGSGGGIYNEGDASLVNVTVNNNAANVGGGLRNTGHMTIINSTVSNNAALLSIGGGIDNDSILDAVNSTISGNTSQTYGGGIANTSLMSLNNVTVANNTTASGGGIYMYNGGTLDIENSLLAYNLASGAKNNCLAPAGSITSYGYNLADDSNSCGLGAAGDKIGTDPLMGALQDNGGTTLTHALLQGSPAIDAGNPAGCKAKGGTSDLLNDQRSYQRPVDGDGNGSAICDIGAFEYGAAPGPGSDLAIQVSGLPNPVVINGNLTYNIFIMNNGPLMAEGVVVTDTLPTNVTFVSSSTNKGVCTGSGTIQCFIGPLFNGESAAQTIVVRPGASGTIYNTATVAGTSADPVLTNNAAIAVTQVSGLLPVRRLSGSTVVGSYDKLQAAFDDSSSGNRVEAMAVPFSENVTIHSNLPIVFSGGYDSTFSARTGYSVIDGTLTFETGTATVEYLQIQ